MGGGKAIMTGRDIHEKITDTASFVPKALDFAHEGRLELDDSDSALEFLTLYLVLLSSAEDIKYDPDKLLKNYLFIKSRLVQNNKISNHEFLSQPRENMSYILQNNLCIMQK